MDTSYNAYPAEFVATVEAGEATITAALGATPVHHLYLAEALLMYRKALLPVLATVSDNPHSDLSLEILVNHLHVRATIEATAVIDEFSTRIADAQRFASARFREAVEVARRSHRLRVISGDSQ